MDGKVEGDEKRTTRPADLVIRVLLSGAGLVVLLVLGQLLG